jgi:hypothetical protein
MTDTLAALGDLIAAIQKNPDLIDRVRRLVDGADGLTDTERAAVRVIRERCGPHLPTVNAAQVPDVIDRALRELGARRLGTWDGGASPLRPTPAPVVRSAIAASCTSANGCADLPTCARAGRCLHMEQAPIDDDGTIDVPVINRATGAALPPAPAAPRTRRTLTDEQWRDAVVDLSQRPGGMTRAQLQKHLGTGKAPTLRAISNAIAAGIIEAVGDRHAKGYHYRYVTPDPGPTTHPRSDHPRADVTAPPAQPVAGTGSNGKISSDPAIRRLVTKIKAAGGTVERLPGGHLRAHGPNGAAVFAATPGVVGPVTISAIRNGTGLDIAL